MQTPESTSLAVYWQRSAKPLFGGSIPPRASNNLQINQRFKGRTARHEHAVGHQNSHRTYIRFRRGNHGPKLWSASIIGTISAWSLDAPIRWPDRDGHSPSMVTPPPTRYIDDAVHPLEVLPRSELAHDSVVPWRGRTESPYPSRCEFGLDGSKRDNRARDVGDETRLTESHGREAPGGCCRQTVPRFRSATDCECWFALA